MKQLIIGLMSEDNTDGLADDLVEACTTGEDVTLTIGGNTYYAEVQSAIVIGVVAVITG
jgi:hypothetical protein